MSDGRTGRNRPLTGYTSYLSASPSVTTKTDNWKRSVYDKQFAVQTPHQDDPNQDAWDYANRVSIPAWRQAQATWQNDLKTKHGSNVTIQNLGSGGLGNGIGYTQSYRVILDENSPTYSTKAATLKPFDKRNREGLIIDKNKEGKNELVDESSKPLQITAEDVLKRRLSLIRMKGRASMPSSNASKDEPTINISSGGAIGLNFA